MSFMTILVQGGQRLVDWDVYALLGDPGLAEIYGPGPFICVRSSEHSRVIVASDYRCHDLPARLFVDCAPPPTQPVQFL